MRKESNMPTRTFHFAPQTYGIGELSKHLRNTISEFGSNPDSTHLAYDAPSSDGWDITKDPASFTDVDNVTEPHIRGISIRAWFYVAQDKLYFGVSGDEKTINITVSCGLLENAQKLIAILIQNLNLQEVRDPLEELIETYKKQDDCPFDFQKIVNEPDLVKILEQRWKESNKTLNAEAYFATIILLGSILEGALFGKIHSNQQKAFQANNAPKQHGQVRPLDEWTLEKLIAVAHECGWIDKDVKDFSTVLRNYRNLVHPRQQWRTGVYPDLGTCKVSKEVVSAAIEDLIK